MILSPTNRVPDVSWRRRRITVRPAEGWQPNRVYRVELLPGVADVRGNKGRLRRVVTFTTGADVPTDSLAGAVIDWKAGRPSAAALVEAVLQPDSLVYRAQADSSGNFRIGPLPRGEYVVYGVLDANKNLRREPREAFDSIRVSGRVGPGRRSLRVRSRHPAAPHPDGLPQRLGNGDDHVRGAARSGAAPRHERGHAAQAAGSVAVPVRALRPPERAGGARRAGGRGFHWRDATPSRPRTTPCPPARPAATRRSARAAPTRRRAGARP